mmetsp:Transcript_132799/g.331308  ORF Transcript_132799/g.331308 Transcript_132799/m.331308 type:complete len:106 (+) Transcript_132799:355-672(+)
MSWTCVLSDLTPRQSTINAFVNIIAMASWLSRARQELDPSQGSEPSAKVTQRCGTQIKALWSMKHKFVTVHDVLLKLDFYPQVNQPAWPELFPDIGHRKREKVID